MASVLERVPVARIQDEAAEVHLGRALLTLVAAVLFGLGWLAGTAWGAVAWSVAAVKVGWQEARATPAPAAGDGG